MKRMSLCVSLALAGLACQAAAAADVELVLTSKKPASFADAAANKVSQQPEKDKADSLNAMNKAIADFTAITSGTEVSNG